MYGHDETTTHEAIAELLVKLPQVLDHSVRKYKEGEFSSAYFYFATVVNVANSMKAISEVQAQAEVGFSLIGDDLSEKAEEFLGGLNEES